MDGDVENTLAHRRARTHGAFPCNRMLLQPPRPPERPSRRMRRTVLARGRLLRMVGPAHSRGPRSAAAYTAMAVPRSLAMASAADRPRCTARAGSALSAAVNVTYAAVGEGLVAWLNNQTKRYASSTVHVTLPSGNVARGNASLRIPYGINLILQGSAMSGASNTTLDLEKNNLDVGGMLGDGGRIEFRNMRVRNVRPSLASAAVRVLPMTLWLVCAGLCGAPASARCRPDACAGCVVSVLLLRHGAQAKPTQAYTPQTSSQAPSCVCC